MKRFKLILSLIATLVCAQALAATPSAIFGTKQRPRPCPADLTVPSKGPPSVEQAKSFLYCASEHEASLVGTRSILMLVDDLQIRIAKQSRPATVSDVFHYREGLKGHIEVSSTSPVYDIKASYRETTCHSLVRFVPGENCTAVFYPMNAGLCFRDTMGDWYCRLHRDSWRSKQPVNLR